MFHPKRGFRKRIHSGEVLLGMFARTGSADLIEIAGFRGMDFVIIDTEHGPADGVDVRDQVRAAECANIAALVRPMKNDPSLILRALDVGAIGVVVPHIQTADDARRAVAAVKFHPQGERGLCPAIRAASFDMLNIETGDWHGYRDIANEETVVVILIEDEEGIRNLPEIVKVPGIDVLFIGGSDLSAQKNLGRNSPELRKITEDAIKLGIENGLAIHQSLRRSDPEGMRHWYGLGVRLFHFTEVALFSEAVASTVKAARAAVGAPAESR